MAHTVDAFVSFSDPKTLNASPVFKSFQPSTNEQNPFTVDQRDIEEARKRLLTPAAPLKPKKFKRTTNPADTIPNPTVQCDICLVPITSQIVYDTHIKGKKHLTLLNTRLKDHPEHKVLTYVELCSRRPEPTAMHTDSDKPVTSTTSLPGPEPSVTTSKTLECRLCNVSCNSEPMFENHIAGRKHQAKLKLNHVTNPLPSRAIPDNNPSSSNYCDICTVRFESENELSEHLAQKRHQTRAKDAEFCAKEAADMHINFDDYKLAESGAESNTFFYQCQTCNKKFKNKMQLIEHLKSALHTRLTNPPAFAKPSREAPQVPRGGLMGRGGTKRRGQSYPFPRGLNRPSRESRPNPVQAAPWTQSFDPVPPPNSDVFGAFSEDEQAKFLSNRTSYAPSTEYSDYPSGYDAFFPKRFRADDRSDDYPRQYPPAPPPPSSLDWQYQPEPYYEPQTSSQYADPAYYRPNPPLPNYDPPPPPPPSYSPSYPPGAPYVNRAIEDQGNHQFYSNNYPY